MILGFYLVYRQKASILLQSSTYFYYSRKLCYCTRSLVTVSRKVEHSRKHPHPPSLIAEFLTHRSFYQQDAVTSTTCIIAIVFSLSAIRIGAFWESQESSIEGLFWESVVEQSWEGSFHLFSPMRYSQKFPVLTILNCVMKVTIPLCHWSFHCYKMFQISMDSQSSPIMTMDSLVRADFDLNLN